MGSLSGNSPLFFLDGPSVSVLSGLLSSARSRSLLVAADLDPAWCLLIVFMKDASLVQLFPVWLGVRLGTLEGKTRLSVVPRFLDRDSGQPGKEVS